MTKTKKILFVTNMYPVNDFKYFGIHVKEQIDSLNNNFPIKSDLYFINGRKSKWNYLLSIVSINLKILFNSYDLIHIHFGLSGLFLLFVPYLKPKVIITLHSGDIDPDKASFFTYRLTKLICQKADKVIILNPKMENELIKIKSKLVMIPCGVDVSIFNTDPLSNHSLPNNEINKHKIYLGFPGNRERKEKNFSMFKQVIDRIKENTQFSIETVEFHSMSREEVFLNLKKLDCLVMTSISEGSPQIIKEAMYLNIPIVSTNVGDIQYLLKNVRNSYVIDNFDTDLMVTRINDILKLDKYNRLSDGKERIINEGLDSYSTSKKLMNLYNQVLEIYNVINEAV